MKIALFLSSLLLADAAATSRKLHTQKGDLLNGADMYVNIAGPEVNANLSMADGVSLYGNASVGVGHPDVAYIYVIDMSGSTGEWDGTCGTVLECVQKFFMEFNKQAIADGSAKEVAVINFDDHVDLNRHELTSPTDPAVTAAIVAGTSSGDTMCTLALEAAARLVKMSAAQTNVVVFAGDGLCNDGGPELETAVSELEATQAIVHTVAVGDGVECDLSQGEINSLGDIPVNKGECFSVPDPNTLPDIIDDLIGTSMTAIELKVDDSNYAVIDSANLTVVSDPSPTTPGEEGPEFFPREGAVAIAFNTTIRGLTPGNHTVCIRANGTDSLEGKTQVEDCHQFTILSDACDTILGWEIALAVLLPLGFAIIMVFAVKSMCQRRSKNEAPKDLDLDVSDKDLPPVV